MELLKEALDTPTYPESLDVALGPYSGMTPQNLFETAAIFNTHLSGSKNVPSKELMSSHIDKVSNDLSFELSRVSNEVAMNGQTAEFSVFMPRLGRLDVRASNMNDNLVLLMKTDSRPFRDKLKANRKKMERSVTRSSGKKTRIRVLDHE